MNNIERIFDKVFDLHNTFRNYEASYATSNITYKIPYHYRKVYTTNYVNDINYYIYKFFLKVLLHCNIHNYSKIIFSDFKMSYNSHKIIFEITYGEIDD